ncbi:hypothetical protein F0P96_14710 [Hymenobacter busanensis]|uniref:Uncharacterized protein n=1 Tax=Hymenobacter busanensis TaxID=2607656 RepID=A0A7L5A0Y4_9BACT|nr:hypothetical protein [Hymenobacter busanensis]KAA9331490.1 hypothetical protein F0P96_14710 [Hymenobacter busanensis]QHJ08645.1 hypothetical protein GUY19_15645 [Hymenobacter busanensis]
MKTLFHSLRLLLPAAALLALVSCSSTSNISMKVPDQLSTATALPVTGKQGFKQTREFGPFATTNVRSGWLSTSGWSAPVGRNWLPVAAWYDQSRAKRKFSFTLQPQAGAPWHVQGAYYSWSQDLTLAPNANSSVGLTLNQEDVYSSIIQGPGHQHTWQLVIESQSRLGEGKQFARGTLSNGDSLLQVRPISQMLRRDGRTMNMPFGVPVGYEFVRPNGSVVGAVELFGRGRVWLSPRISPELQAPVAAAMASMLLRQD